MTINKTKNQNLLPFWTIIYLGLPSLIFILGWLKPLIALPGTVFFITSIYFFYQSLSDEEVIPFHSKLTLNGQILIWLLAISSALYAGIGGYIFHGDTNKHFAIIFDLINKSWPVVYEENYLTNDPVFLDYYIGYYLPTGLLGKIFGITHSNLILIIWASVGIYLVFRWVLIFSGENLIFLSIIVFLLLGGQDFLYSAIKVPIKYLFTGVWNDPYIFKMEVAAEASVHNNLLQYYGPMVGLTWAPQHYIGGWLATSLFIHQILYKKSLSNIGFIMSLTPIWSIFNTIGLVPFFLFFAFYFRLKKIFSFQNLLGGGFCMLVMFFYFQAHFSIEISGWVWEFIPGKSWPFKVIIFAIVEYGLYLLLIYKFILKSQFKLFTIISAISLLLITLYAIGMFNDFLMRSGVPGMFVISIVLVKYFKSVQQKKLKWVLGLIVLMSCIPYFYLRYRVKERLAEQEKIENSSSVVNIYEDTWFNSQYLGKSTSIFYKYLSK
ncbi:hypothetical protein [Flexithrix dorotheae]|uniref:hypothetical protein n=1 Tax=Flexithrix dorotheae TaxID=70993 RepID=UPI0003731000|nr:hypothetical protein [Flexithrix dorotheae]